MSDDLVRRLRDAHANSTQRIFGSNIFNEAATEIERLRATPLAIENEQFRAERDAAESELSTLRARASELASENTNLRNDLVQRGMAEESLRARVREVVGPFAEAADDICDQSSDSAHIWEAPCAMNITRGHLRAARQLMEEVK